MKYRSLLLLFLLSFVLVNAENDDLEKGHCGCCYNDYGRNKFCNSGCPTCCWDDDTSCIRSCSYWCCCYKGDWHQGKICVPSCPSCFDNVKVKLLSCWSFIDRVLFCHSSR